MQNVLQKTIAFISNNWGMISFFGYLIVNEIINKHPDIKSGSIPELILNGFKKIFMLKQSPTIKDIKNTINQETKPQ